MKDLPAASSTSQNISWYACSSEEVLSAFKSAHSGISTLEAANRLRNEGSNKLKVLAPISPFKILIDQFKSFIIWILIVAGVISGVLGQAVDAIAILSIVLLNAAIGFYQEWNAVKSIAALKKMAAPQAKVKRGGRIHHIPSSQIVTGDILLLEAGDVVAADARLLSAASLRCDESTLTGESVAVSKNSMPLENKEIPLGDRSNMVFMGTHVVAGKGEAIVVATGMKTELGRISELLDQPPSSARIKPEP